ncbi:unnamed protein product [Clavelina lepadiformis]|uniref:Peptidase S72 domain-containing protein n=1 Tax=Clavelina lepadiformis TaxID=159417 RepID=A0ABP0GD79_CLALP
MQKWKTKDCIVDNVCVTVNYKFYLANAMKCHQRKIIYLFMPVLVVLYVCLTFVQYRMITGNIDDDPVHTAQTRSVFHDHQLTNHYFNSSNKCVVSPLSCITLYNVLFLKIMPYHDENFIVHKMSSFLNKPRGDFSVDKTAFRGGLPYFFCQHTTTGVCSQHKICHHHSNELFNTNSMPDTVKILASVNGNHWSSNSSKHFTSSSNVFNHSCYSNAAVTWEVLRTTDFSSENYESIFQLVLSYSSFIQTGKINATLGIPVLSWTLLSMSSPLSNLSFLQKEVKDILSSAEKRTALQTSQLRKRRSASIVQNRRNFYSDNKTMYLAPAPATKISSIKDTRPDSFLSKSIFSHHLQSRNDFESSASGPDETVADVMILTTSSGSHGQSEINQPDTSFAIGGSGNELGSGGKSGFGSGFLLTNPSVSSFSHFATNKTITSKSVSFSSYFTEQVPLKSYKLSAFISNSQRNLLSTLEHAVSSTPLYSHLSFRSSPNKQFKRFTGTAHDSYFFSNFFTFATSKHEPMLTKSPKELRATTAELRQMRSSASTFLHLPVISNFQSPTLGGPTSKSFSSKQTNSFMLMANIGTFTNVALSKNTLPSTTVATSILTSPATNTAEPQNIIITATFGKLFVYNLPLEWKFGLVRGDATVSGQNNWLSYNSSGNNLYGVLLDETPLHYTLVITPDKNYGTTAPSKIILDIQVEIKRFVRNPSYLVKINSTLSNYLQPDNAEITKSRLAALTTVFLQKVALILPYVTVNDITVHHADVLSMPHLSNNVLTNGKMLQICLFIEKFGYKSFFKHYQPLLEDSGNKEGSERLFFALLPDFVLNTVDVVGPEFVHGENLPEADEDINSTIDLSVILPIALIACCLVLSAIFLLIRHKRKRLHATKYFLVDRTFSSCRFVECIYLFVINTIVTI